jgi:hypothetical protein
VPVEQDARRPVGASTGGHAAVLGDEESRRAA